MIAIGYVRRSKESSERTISLEVQREQIAAHAREQGFDLREIVADDGVSGGKRSRFARIREAVAAHGASVVIVANLDRFARDAAGALAEIDAFGQRGISLHVAGRGPIETATATGFLQAGVESLLAEHYRRLVAEKTRAALAAKRSKGERTGEIPFGYAVAADGLLVADQSEQAIIAIIRELRSGGMTLAGIAEALNQRGHRTRRGTPWRLQYVARVLDRAA